MSEKVVKIVHGYENIKCSEISASQQQTSVKQSGVFGSAQKNLTPCRAPLKTFNE